MHDYLGVDLGLVYRAVEQDVPQLNLPVRLLFRRWNNRSRSEGPHNTALEAARLALHSRTAAAAAQRECRQGEDRFRPVEATTPMAYHDIRCGSLRRRYSRLRSDGISTTSSIVSSRSH